MGKRSTSSIGSRDVIKEDMRVAVRKAVDGHFAAGRSVHIYRGGQILRISRDAATGKFIEHKEASVGQVHRRTVKS